MSCDVVITGIGAVTPLGMGIDETWTEIVAGSSSAGRLTRFDPSEYELRPQIACEVKHEFTDVDGIDARSMGRYTRMSIVAAREALMDAEFHSTADAWSPKRIGTALASGMGGIPSYEDGVDSVEAKGRVSPRFLVSFLPNLAAGHVSIEFDARGPNRAPATACAAGNQAIADAVDDIRLDRADVMIAGGTESTITPTAMVGFDSMRALSTRNDTPEAASRPFDANRDGFVMGEGAGILLLESREHAEKRGATPYAEISGVGFAGDATHPTRPPDNAHGLSRAMNAALEESGVTRDAVDYVNAHATSTPSGDSHEATAIRRTLKDDTLVWGPKSALGHTLGAAGAIETVLTAQSIATKTIPPTLNYETPDEECDVRVQTDPVEMDVTTALCNAAGFGGTNTSLLVTAP